MKSIVIDASIAIKWFVPEVHSIDAIRLLDGKLKFLAPDLIFAEFGNILWKKHRLKELAIDTGNMILEDFKRLPFNSFESVSLLNTAWQIATEYRCTVYDSLYVALAQTEGALLVTADRTLCNVLAATPLASLLLWVEDIKNII